VHRDWSALAHAFGEVVAFEDPRDGVALQQAHDVFILQRLEPFAVEANLSLLAVQDLEDLRFVGLGVRVDLRTGHRRTRRVASTGVADESGHVADQEDHGVAEILKVLHLAQQHSVAKVEVWRGGIESRLDA
jgi:hypothetical protein